MSEYITSNDLRPSQSWRLAMQQTAGKDVHIASSEPIQVVKEIAVETKIEENTDNGQESESTESSTEGSTEGQESGLQVEAVTPSFEERVKLVKAAKAKK